MVERPDLTAWRPLSKSALTAFDLCQQKAWQGRHHPRPFINNPTVTFGSAVDAGVEVILAYARMGQGPNLNRANAAMEEITKRDGIDIDLDEANEALTQFVNGGVDAKGEPTAAPLAMFDWHNAQLQEHLNAPLWDIGDADGHPDIILPSGVYDVKTSSRKKSSAKSLELGYYACLQEAVSGKPVAEVGYITWVRLVRPYWQVLTAEVTDDLRRWTRARVSAYVRAVRVDSMLNTKGVIQNWSFPGGPRDSSFCRTCQYNPALGGACDMAPQGDIDDA